MFAVSACLKPKWNYELVHISQKFSARPCLYSHIFSIDKVKKKSSKKFTSGNFLRWGAEGYIDKKSKDFLTTSMVGSNWKTCYDQLILNKIIKDETKQKA